ncbi:glycosyltransferase family 2 protein [Halalkalibacter nanhaiisediminis]|uniref:Glycosyl transferase family 2 n=1 Tax=Halalkalibacter nanhaiisediminis TaxID=688079 RepID=A0A562QT12_9BACI|nr:glycosyltransferase family 2 protein [Halalkalibacter nanhaiisediminis]TWI59911.1 glycosyl transferase family 2 [Halalkalibacter nanhaiisediminis]
MPLVSVIIPTYHRPIYLCEALESIHRQTCKDLEVVIINNGDEDIDYVVELYPELGITILPFEENHPVKARNRGVQVAKGEYIMLLDDDDMITPCHLERMVGELEDVDLVYTDAEIFDYVTEDKSRIPTQRLLFAYDNDLAGMRTFSTYLSSGSLYRKDIHQKIGYFDAEVYNYWDWDFFLRVSEVGLVRRVPVASVLYAFSNMGDNLSKNVASKERKARFRHFCTKHHLGPLPSRNFLMLLEEPELVSRKAESLRVWDGEAVVSRLEQGVCDSII